MYESGHAAVLFPTSMCVKSPEKLQFHHICSLDQHIPATVSVWYGLVCGTVSQGHVNYHELVIVSCV